MHQGPQMGNRGSSAIQRESTDTAVSLSLQMTILVVCRFNGRSGKGRLQDRTVGRFGHPELIIRPFAVAHSREPCITSS